ncbi:ATP-binding protein [Dactylosporangium sp. CA-092794]|uniref:ATP-binding protein n=1 Tax=Dactylosporangium sp. CA-092794 TaxID=3239929 RepID=UPI003D8CBEBE
MADDSTKLSTFVGREHDMIETRRMLRNARLLTLTGLPGAGKSRLALEVAAREQRVNHRCTVFVDFRAPEMAQLDAPDIVPSLARTAEGRIASGADLLVLDNCERVLETCGPLVVGLLSRFPELRIMTTSREPWRLPGEVTYRLAGLSLPDRTMAADPDECLRADAVRLLVDRARAADRDFVLTPDNVAGLCEISVILDGLPLALELAAQLLRALPVAEATRQLVRDPSVLGQGWRTSDVRHRSWAASVRWSYDGLAEPEQALFRRVSLLPGPFTIDAARVACSGRPDLAGTAAELLVSLEAKSLAAIVRTEQGRSGEFVVPASVRIFGRHEAARAGERDDVLDRLATWLTGHARDVYHRTPASRAALRRLIRERETIRALLRWLAPTSDVRQLSLSWALAVVETQLGGDSAEALPIVGHALRVTDTASAHRAQAYEGALGLACWHGDGGYALSLAPEAVRAGRRAGEDLPLARTLLLSSVSEEMYGDLEAARRDLLAAFGIARRHDDEVVTAMCRAQLARHLLRHGRTDGAHRLLGRSVPVLRAASSVPHLCAALLTLGALELGAGNIDRARGCYREILAAPYALGTSDSVLGLALCAVRENSFERALTLFAMADGERGFAALLFPSWSERLDEARGLATGILSKARADAATQLGRELGREQAVRYACEMSAPAIARRRDATLTSREWEVLRQVMDGLTNSQIAHRLHLSVRTVETHIRNIRTVLGLRSRAHMAAWAARHPATAA